MPAPHDTAIEHWTRALQTYRASVDLYAQVVQLRHRREVRPWPTPTAARSALGAPSPPPVLHELTAREREIAILIARGLTNRQIARTLVIAPGTAANHVANVIAKLQLVNRTQVAIAVTASIDADVAASCGQRPRIVSRSNGSTSTHRTHDLRSIV